MLAVITLLSLFALAATLAVEAAILYGIAYLGGKLFGPDVPEADTGETPNAQSRSWNPRSTQQEGIARPRAWGKNMHHGNIVAKWTDVVDNREVLYIIVEHGDGPTEGIVTPVADNVFLNDQPAGNFGDVDIQERVGTMNQTVMTGFEKTKLEYPIGNELILNEPIIFTTHNDFFDDIEYTIMWPNGLRKYQKSGKRKTSSCTVKVRIREHPSGDWTIIFNSAVSSSALEPLFKLYKINTLSPGYVERGKQYDLEFTNLTGPSERHINDVYIKSAREVVDAAFTRPGKALVGIRAIATTQLSGNIDVKIIREDRLINVWNGSTWTIEYSRNRSWIVFDAFTQPVIDGDGESGNPFAIHHYEGLDPSRLDLAFFLEWASFCSDQVPDGFGGTEDRIACDTILDFQTNVWKFTNELANVGRASLYWQGFLLTGWIDKEVSETTALVTMDNVMARSWVNQWVEPGELAGRIEVFFNDSRQGYERAPASLPNESAGKYTKIISIEGIGVTTRGTAIHVANHALKRNELIRNINNFRQYKDAFRYKLGKVLRIQHRTPNWGESYRVVRSTANNKVTLDRICSAIADELLFIQSYDETLEKVRTDSYTVLSVSGKVVTIVETWDVTPLKNYMVAVGVVGETKLRRIIKIDSTADNYFDITVETYDTNLFDADDLDPDNPDQNYIWGAPANPLMRPVTRADVIEMIYKLAAPQPDVDTPATSNLTWSGDDVDTVTWAKTDADEAIVFRYKGTDYEITPDSTTDEFIYWDPDYTTIFRTTNILTTAFTLGKWVMCRNKDGVAYPATPIAIMHGGIIQIGTIIASQIIITGINALNLMNAPAEAGADVTGGHQGDISLANLGEKNLNSLTNKIADYIAETATRKWAAENGADVTAGKSITVLINRIADNIAETATKKWAAETGADVTAGKSLSVLIDRVADNIIETATKKWAGETGADITAGKSLSVLINRVADSISETATRKWAAEAGADITGDHQAATIVNQGALAVLNVVGGAYIDALAVDTLHIKGVAVTTEKIADSATKIYAEAANEAAWDSNNYTNGSWRNLISVNITSEGGVVVVEGECNLLNRNSSNANPSLRLNVTTAGVVRSVDVDSYAVGDNIRFTAHLTLGSGSKTATLEGIGTMGGSGYCELKSRWIKMTEDKGK